MALPLYLIFKESLSSGTAPRIWKETLVTYGYKKELKCDPKNYRPISVTSVACGILESTVGKELIKICREQKNYPAESVWVCELSFHHHSAV